MKFVLAVVIAVQFAVANWAAPDEWRVKPFAGCDNTFINESGVITSPEFPNSYPANSNCSWLIFGPSGKNVLLNFTTFVLEPDRDFVQVFDGPINSSPLLLNHSGFELPSPLISSANALLVEMTSNQNNQYSGFRAEYTSIIATTTTTSTLPPSNDCGGTLFGSGVIRSPNFPDPYNPMTNCTWFLQSSSPFISFNFSVFVTETKADYVEIWDGWDTSVAALDRKSGDLTAALPSYLSETGNKFAVRFVSDDSVEELGFEADFA